MCGEGTGPEYVLRTGDDELERLGFQHQVWGAQASAQWERAGFRPGQTLLDVGCGPGHAALDLADLVGPSGRVVAYDESPRFVAHLEEQLRRRGVRNVEVRRGDVQELDLPAESVDGAWARWVLCFVPRPGDVVERVARALRPGGTFAILDYFNYRALALGPRSEPFERVVRAVDASFRARGGDPDVAGRLPGLLAASGLRVREVRPVVRLAAPGSLLWQWPRTFFRNYLPVLLDMDLITREEARAFEDELEARERDPASFLSTPPVLEIIAGR